MANLIRHKKRGTARKRNLSLGSQGDGPVRHSDAPGVGHPVPGEVVLVLNGGPRVLTLRVQLRVSSSAIGHESLD